MDMPYCAGALWGIEYPDMWAWSMVMGTMGYMCPGPNPIPWNWSEMYSTEEGLIISLPP